MKPHTNGQRGPLRRLRKSQTARCKQRQGEQQAQSKDAEFVTLNRLLVATLSGILNLLTRCVMDGLVLVDLGLLCVQRFNLLLLFTLRLLQRFQPVGAFQNLRILAVLLGSGAGGNPGVEAVLLALGGSGGAVHGIVLSCAGVGDHLQLVVVCLDCRALGMQARLVHKGFGVYGFSTLGRSSTTSAPRPMRKAAKMTAMSQRPR